MQVTTVPYVVAVAELLTGRTCGHCMLLRNRKRALEAGGGGGFEAWTRSRSSRVVRMMSVYFGIF